MEIKFTKRLKNATLPIKATKGAAGYDLTTVAKDDDGEIITYDTGLSIAIPSGYVGLLFSRSSVYKTGLLQCNAVGVLDPDYTGPIKFKFWKFDKTRTEYNVGERIGQLVIVPALEIDFKEVDKLDETDRGEGGFGSTGK